MKRPFHGLQERWQQKRKERTRRPWRAKERLVRQGLEIFKEFGMEKVASQGWLGKDWRCFLTYYWGEQGHRQVYQQRCEPWHGIS